MTEPTHPAKGLLDAVHDNINLVREFGYEMESIARAAAIMGNRELAETLRSWVVPLNESARSISDAWNVELSEKISHNNAMFGEVLKAMIDGGSHAD